MIIAEYINNAYSHVDGNAASIALFLKLNSGESIHLFCSQSHYEAIIEILKKNNINIENIIHHPINVPKTLVKDYSGFGNCLNLVKIIYSFALKKQETNITFLTSSPILLYIIKVFCIFYRDIKIICYIHGDLEKVDIKSYVKHSIYKNKILLYLYVLFFGFKIPLLLPNPSNLKLLVYGDSIKQNLLKVMPNLRNSVYSIPHPYLYKKNAVSNTQELSFGVIGVCDIRKNSYFLRKLIEKLSVLKKDNFAMLFSGKISDNELYSMLLNCNFVKKESLSQEMLPTDLRNKTIEKMTYTVFTYNLDTYKYTASGAFIDAINYEKPIIALSTSYIQHYFNKYGNIGYIFDNYSDLENKIIEIINNFPQEEYQEQVNNIKKIKENESLENIVKLFQ